MKTQFLHHLFQSCRANKGHQFLLAVSGGLDSMVLLDLFLQSNLDLEVAHCNFQLRGVASDEDAKFVQQVCKAKNIDCVVQNFKTSEIVATSNSSVQMVARELRYTWFESLRNEKGCHFIVTAHHANDQLESVLLNLIRGTGIKGMQGMKPKNGYLLRPLLSISKEALQAYANENSIDYREDRSNEDTKYMRNKLRLDILPNLIESFPKVLDSLSRNQEIVQNQIQIYEFGVAQMQKKLLQHKGKDIWISIEQLRRVKGYKGLLFDLFHEFNLTAPQIPELLKIIEFGVNGAIIITSTHRFIKERKHVVIASLLDEEASYHAVDRFPVKVKLPEFTLCFDAKNIEKFNSIASAKEAWFDADKVKLPIIIRRRKNGDYFYPLGLTKPNSEKHGKKKLSKYFKDEKFSTLEKERVYIVTDATDKVLWVVGHRQDQRCAITDLTKKTIQLKMKNSRSPR